ncbi:hypothetical protein RchiOBHm_Chr5g0062041 [Rosa chinensis]|uniref:Uncharacterized protein n=1 Tax=Rosa chinensis TaxID=74649 RepID=A0A2P6QI31_ROSCH|nr:hypothetical protein RchiOBHm_Chr5g0062041 [Rosa chinensis]
MVIFKAKDWLWSFMDVSANSRESLSTQGGRISTADSRWRPPDQ